ncbi:MAG: SGNH/GDSL hydrolase family protein [Gordonia sp. (in: high G+C Gram-positive bacteria)]
MTAAPASTFSRYIALGDSFTEGVGDADDSLPNGVRGWADQVAAQLARVEPGLEYANLAIRGLKMDAVLDRQVPEALAAEPDLVSIYAGGNDMLRPAVDIDALIAAYDDAIGRITGGGARVVLFTPHDPGSAALFGSLRGRFAIYCEGVRRIAEKYDAVLVDFWRIPEYQDPRFWDTDRLHMSTIGHRRMAVAVLDALGVDHTLTAPDLPAYVEPPFQDRLVGHIRWTAGFLAPWIGRRLRGVSSGDTLSPRYPALVRPVDGL